jgi:arylsulfatase A-like enzyme
VSSPIRWLVFVVALGGGSRLPAAPPNVLFLFADDLRADALGNPGVIAPTLNALAGKGFTFRNAYCLGANVGAVCTPSRNMLMSGRAYFRWAGNQAPADGPNFPAAMKAAGYQTYHHGKKGNVATAIQASFEVNKYLADDQAERRSGEPGRVIADDAVAFLKGGRDGRPFFMYLAFGNPHDPRVAARKYLDQYDAAKIPLPRNYLPAHAFDNGEMTVRDEQLAPWPRTEAEVRKQLREYYATITAFDGHVGRVLTALRELGLDKNTLIVFSADHGLAVGSHGLFGKQSLYDHSMKAPLVFAGPGIPTGSSPALAYLLDIFPTVADYAGASTPAGLDGMSLKPVIDGKSVGVRDSLFLAYRNVQRAVRDDRWKLIRYPQVDRTQLFDLMGDPDEMRDRSADPDQAGRVERMRGLMADWQKRLGDSQPWAVADPKPAAWTPPKKR